MKNLILLSLVFGYIFCACSGNQPKQTIHFKPLVSSAFNFSADSSFAIPKGKIAEERKRSHDSCMGESFAGNAVFLKTKDTFRLGTIVNMKTMKEVKEVKDFNMIMNQPNIFGNAVTFITKPCYDKMQLNISPDSFVNEKIILSIPGAAESINHELNNAFNTAIYTEMEAGSWLNIELTDAFGKILDTTTDPQLLEYKKYLLDTTNMVLIKSSSITDVNFTLTTAKPLSNQLLQALKQKPVAEIANSKLRTQLFFISNNSFQVKFSGIFQVMGQFMQCELN